MKFSCQGENEENDFKIAGIAAGKQLDRRYSELISDNGSIIQLGDLTTVLQCPICGNEIVGIGEKNLSDHLLDHMTDVHEINLTWGEATSGDSSKDLEGGSNAAEKKIEMKESGVSSSIAVRCPICREELVAPDDESLSSDLRNHLLMMHAEVRRLTDWLGAQRDVPRR